MNLIENSIYNNISKLLNEARKNVKKVIDITMVNTYFEIGKLIVEEEQKGKERAEYGKELVKNLAIKLTDDFGKGFSKRNIENIRKFYLAYSIVQNGSAQFKLGFTQYIILSNIVNIDERNFYEIEAINNGWNIKELRRQIDSALYERLALSRKKEEVKKLSTKGQIIEKSKDLIKDPYILEFLGLEEMPKYSGIN